MSKFTRLEVAQKMIDTALVPLFYHQDVELAKQVVSACYQGGARVLEFTNRGDGAHRVFEQVLDYARTDLPDLALGIGSIIDAPTAALFMQMGADFIVSPSLREDVALVANRRKVLWSAGCLTPTEIGRAEELGCEIVKVFPGDSMGPDFVKALLGPSPWTRIMPTGGVSPDEDNLRGWFSAGVTCVGMGSQLIRKDWLKHKSYSEIENLVRRTMDQIAQIRAEI